MACEPRGDHASFGRYYHQQRTRRVTISPAKGVSAVSTAAVPRTVRIAGVLTTLQAVAGLVFVVALLVRGSATDLGGTGTLNRADTYGEAGYYALLVAGVLAAGIGLWKGKHWARTPTLLLQLLLLGTAWYAFGPSGRPLIALAIAVPAIAVLWFLFNREGRAWAFHASTAPDAEPDDR
jgi:cbb3-type cytochrome oxidase subunit 3